jgi:hypothetical protein
MTAPMPIPAEGPPSGGERWMYWTVGAVVIALAVLGLINYSGAKRTAEAEQKAQELTQRLEQAGLRAPADQDIFVRSLGTDGGNVCDNPGEALGKAVLYDSLANGAAFVGRRPVIVDRRIVLGEALILETYCPDKLQEYREAIDDLKFDDTIKD